MAERYKHNATGTEYIFLAHGKMKVNDEWVDAAFYYNDQGYYSRSLADFQLKFTRL